MPSYWMTPYYRVRNQSINCVDISDSEVDLYTENRRVGSDPLVVELGYGSKRGRRLNWPNEYP